MSGPYPDSNYASERICEGRCCEADGAEKGWCVKCDHCQEEFEVGEDPKPCIERIAAELEALLAKRGES
jgi:hypothetical protein